MRKDNPIINTIGKRILVIGNSCSGKSTLAGFLASVLDVPFIELDSLNWEENWVSLAEKDPEELTRRFQKATSGECWVVAGSYTEYSKEIFWEKLETIIWLDMPMYLLIWRMLCRSWRRWRTNELLWGTNYERISSQLMFWRSESLLNWIIKQHQPKRNEMLQDYFSSEWGHIRFIRICSRNEINSFLKNEIK